MLNEDDFEKKIREANINVHRIEAKYYDLIHPEVYGKFEQKRIDSILKKVDKFVKNNSKFIGKALDFGSGTGNLTGKLLAMGYEVTAVDISAEMCKILEIKFQNYIKSNKLCIINSPIEDVNFNRDSFDLITCYSVLHHLPNYIDAIRRLSCFLKDEGVMYIDHEISPFYWKNESSILAGLVKLIYFHSNPLLNSLYFGIVGVNVPTLDYEVSDYWFQKEHSLDHKNIKSVFVKEKFKYFKRTDYHLMGSWFWNPFFFIYRTVCKPEMSFWIAKK